MKYLIVGLGNIGNEYSYTRHNIGFDVADALATKLNVSFETQRYGDVATGRIKGKTLVILKPSTYMNLSGKAMAYWMQKENIALDHVLVIVDDLALPLGSLRLKERGSDAGHNGLKNIQAIVGTDAYPRLRFGIGNDFPKGFQVDFVLGKWTEEETKLLPAKIATSLEIIQAFVLMGIHRTMNDFNKRK